MITNLKGNLLTMFKRGSFDAIVHGSNCFHVMGAGIAGQIATEFPEALEADKLSRLGDIDKLGSYTVANTKFGYIMNGYTQYHPGREDKSRLYASIDKLFKTLGKDAFPSGYVVGIPMIGSGIAGGNWNEIREIIKPYTEDISIVVVEYVAPINPAGNNRRSSINPSRINIPKKIKPFKDTGQSITMFEAFSGL